MTETSQGAPPSTLPSSLPWSRRALLASAASVPLVAIISRRGEAAEFTYKFATGQDPTHPVNVRAAEALTRIREASGGRLDMKLFPANQLGSDTGLLSQVRNGGVEFFNLATSILNTLVPAAGLLSIGFAFADTDAVVKAIDGPLGTYLAEQIGKVGLVSVTPLWSNGFRQITSSTRDILAPADLKGFKIRVPPAPILTSLFQALGASPRPSTSTSSIPRCRPGSSRGRRTPYPSSPPPSSTRCRSR